MSITAAGVGSGLDLESLITSLVGAERDIKIASYQARTSELNVELSAVGEINSKVDGFKTAVDNLNDLTDFQKRTATITQPSIGDIISVSPGSSATTGSYDISVQTIAQGSRSESAAAAFTASTDVVSAIGGDLTFTSGTESFVLTVPAGATLEELRELINGDDNNYGVSANIVNTGTDARLVLTSDVMGTGNDLVVTNSDASLDAVSTNMTINAGDEAKSAEIYVDGLFITNDTNEFENVVSGLSITALKESSGETATTKVDVDKAGVQKLIEGFISSYNSMLAVFDEATQIGAVLSGDSTIRSIESQMSRTLMSQFSNTGAFETIFDLGIEMDNEGKLSIDSTKLSDALTNGFDDVANMFAAEDTGLATLMSNLLDPYTQTGGILDERKDTIKEQIDQTAESEEAFEFRMEAYEKTLRQQYTALDGTLATLNAQNSYVTAQLANLPGFTSDN